MQPVPDAITDLDLDAYVDGQLDDWQRLRVEAHLAQCPTDAARVMRDIHLVHELRLALAPAAPDSPLLRTAARRLSRGLARDARLRRAFRLVPVVTLVAVGWLAHEGLGPLSIREGIASEPPPAFVPAAVAAREATVARMAMASQPEVTDLDAGEIRASTGIMLPHFAADWTIRDAQVFPSPQGPGVEILFDTPDMGAVTLFSVRPGTFAVTFPKPEPAEAESIAWFQVGETAHVLIAGAGRTEALMAAARGQIETLQ